MAEASIKPVYVLHGDDAFLMDAHRREIIARVVGQADPQLGVSSFEAEAELAEVLDELRTAPFLAPHRLVIVRDADGFVTAHREALEKFLASPPASGSLLLICRQWRRDTRLAKLVAKIGQAIDCSAPEDRELVGWVAKAAARRGKKADGDVAEMLVEWVGRNLAALDSEIEKLSLYVGDRPSITAEDIAAVVSASAGPEAFALSNALTAGDAAAALKALGGMLQVRGDEFKTLGSIAWHLRRAVAAKEQILAGVPPRQAMPRMPYQQVAAFEAMLRRRRLSAFQADLRRLIRADLAMKSGSSPVAALQTLVVELCS